MNRGITAYVLITCLGLCMGGTAVAFEYHLRGQLSGWYLEAREEGDRVYSAGVRYIPQLDLLQEITTGSFVDLEASVNAWAALMSADPGDDADLDLYRLKIRYATAMTETRLGLQVMNFGPAYLLRPLRWFDRLDPRDPLKLTDGVYALLFKFTAPNNANIWLWGLHYNDELKGYEFMTTSDDRPEFGGRLQFPIGPGEAALTVNNRKVDPQLTGSEEISESRFAIDGRWDIEIGLWFEAVLQQQTGVRISTAWTKTATIGADYTIGIGNGIHILLEHMVSCVSTKEPMLDPGRDTKVSALMLGYPSGYLDYFNAICFYDWENGDFYSFLSWQRTWDDFALNLSLFHNPQQVENGLDSMSARGTGGQAIVMFNH